MMILETDKIEYMPKVDYGKKNSDGCTVPSVEPLAHLTANGRLKTLEDKL